MLKNLSRSRGLWAVTIRKSSETTCDVLLESAYFNPSSVRATAKALGISTEASYRFERGADPGAVLTALDRAAQLIAELAGGTESVKASLMSIRGSSLWPRFNSVLNASISY